MDNAIFENTTYNYTAVFEPAEEGGYTVYIPALPGCISEGDTFEEAKQNIQEAAELYIEVLQAENNNQHVIQSQDYIVAPIHVKGIV